jgi:cyclin A
MATTYAGGVPAAAWYGYGYDADIGASFRAMLGGIQSAALACWLPSPTDAHDAAPTTPVAVLPAPRSYGDDAVSINIKTPPPEKQPQQEQCGSEYDASIDATFRVMETDPAERPSPDYLSGTQTGDMMMIDRAALIKKMHHFSRYYGIAPCALHRAVSYVDRFLSARKMNGGERQLLLLGAAAVFAASKYEDRKTTWRINADAVAAYAGCTRREAHDAERELVAALGYRLSGPTAYTFVEHFMRHTQGQEEEGSAAAVVRALAHHLAGMALLDYRCVAFLPSVVAASAIVLARLVVLGYNSTLAPVAGYATKDLIECMEAIYDLHDNLQAWPGCEEMMRDWEVTTRLRYSLPPPSMLMALR